MLKALAVQRFLSNMLFLLGASIGNAVALFLFTTYAAQHLDKAAFGKFSTVQIFVTSFFVLTELGLTSAVIREISQKREQARFIAGNFLAIKLVIGPLALITAVTIAIILGYEPGTLSLIIIYSSILISFSINNACVAIFNGHERMEYSSVVNMSGFLGYTMGGIGLAFGFKLGTVFLLIVAGSLIGTGTGLIILYSRFQVKHLLIFDRKMWHRLFMAALPFGVIEILTRVGVTIGPIMLSRTMGETSVGNFNIANSIANVFMLIVTAYNSAVYPLFGRLEVSSQEKLQLGYRISIKFLLIFGSGVVTVLTVTAGKIVKVLFPGYESAIPAIQILAWFVFFSFLATPSFNVLYAERRQNEVAQIAVVATLVGVGVNILFIPAGVIGVCIALVSITFVQCGISYLKVSKKFMLSIKRSVLQAVVIAAIISLLGILFQTWNLFALLLLMGTAFSVAVFSLDVFDAREWNILSGLPFIHRLIK